MAQWERGSRLVKLVRTRWALPILMLTACGGGTLESAAPDRKPLDDTCAGLLGLRIDASAIGLPTRGATVSSASRVAASGTGSTSVGAYCAAIGRIEPVDPAAPAITFQVNLPNAWNAKALMLGNGGFGGILNDATGRIQAGPTDQPGPLGRGYVTIGNDSGHQAGPDGSRDGSFGLVDEALRNWAGDSVKKTRDVATAIIRAHYGQPASKTYFAGGSNGGREALLAVQRWPADFDGAIALWPAWSIGGLYLHAGRMTRQLAKPGSYPNRARRKLLFDAAMAACDGLDGAQDGLISNPKACHASFDPSFAMLNGQPLRCPGGADTGNDTCLSAVQIASFAAFNISLVLEYALANGDTTYPGFNTWGTDFGGPGNGPLDPVVLFLGMGTQAPANPMPGATAISSPPFGSILWDQWVRYFVTRNPGFNPLTLDPEKPGPWQSRVVELSGLMDVSSSDLSPFRARGGKLLLAHGTSDQLVSTRASEQFYGRIRKTMGFDEVASFVRFYEIPGMGHGASSVFNASWDSLTALENWVEKGIAPTGQVVADTAGVPGRTRPLCDYPSWPKYRGSGDVNLASSFTCASQ